MTLHFIVPICHYFGKDISGRFFKKGIKLICQRQKYGGKAMGIGRMTVMLKTARKTGKRK